MRPSVLHVVESLERGAVENWLLRMLGRAQARGMKLDWTFYCALGEEGTKATEARALGARVIASPVAIGDKLEFVRALRAETRQGYDVLHCHHDLVSAVYLVAAVGVPLRRRIVHVHNADEQVLTPSTFKQWLYREPMRSLCLSLADRIVGISKHTLRTFLAGRAPREDRDVVRYYGIDPLSFARPFDRAAFRRKLGLPDAAPLLLFAGRMVPEKNPRFVVDVARALKELDPTTAAVFVGDGPLAREVRDYARGDAVHFFGWRGDVADFMRASDLFILPHVEHALEGLGIAVVEAQLADLPLLLSKGVADDPLLSTARYESRPLGEGAKAWARAAKRLLASKSTGSAIDALARSPFDMDRALDGLLELYA